MFIKIYTILVILKISEAFNWLMSKVWENLVLQLFPIIILIRVRTSFILSFKNSKISRSLSGFTDGETWFEFLSISWFPSGSYFSPSPAISWTFVFWPFFWPSFHLCFHSFHPSPWLYFFAISSSERRLSNSQCKERRILMARNADDEFLIAVRVFSSKRNFFMGS